MMEAGRGRAWSQHGALTAIVLLATVLRVAYLDRPSLFYDEVIVLKLASQPDPAALLKLLQEIDATRAPLHPLLLQGWVALFGASALAGRAFSVVCGVLTVLLIDRIGRRAFGPPTGLWAAFLFAISPMQVRYAQEVRMYALLVLETCIAWNLLFSFRDSAPPGKQAAYLGCLIALGYTHPLGLFMAAALGLAYLERLTIEWRTRETPLRRPPPTPPLQGGEAVRGQSDSLTPPLAKGGLGGVASVSLCATHAKTAPGSGAGSRLAPGRWLAIQLVAAVAIAPWAIHYVDHSPEIIVGRLPLRFLIGLPIGYIGGNSLTLLGFITLAVYGMFARRGEAGPGAINVWLEHVPWRGIRPPPTPPSQGGEPKEAPTPFLLPPLRRGGWGGSALWLSQVCQPSVNRSRLRLDQPAATLMLLTWFAVPPLLLYGHSLVSAAPIFGPPRYTLFVGPAYLILVAHGLAKLPRLPRYATAATAAVLAGMLLRTLVYAPDVKADWRDAAVQIRAVDPRSTIVYLSDEPANLRQFVPLRHYLGPDAKIVMMTQALEQLADDPQSLGATVWTVVEMRDGRPRALPPKAWLRRYASTPLAWTLPGVEVIYYRLRRPPDS